MQAVERSIFTVRRAYGATIEAEALVSPVHFSPRYDLDRTAGTFSRVGHPLEGQSISGKILFLPSPQGGVAGGWVFFELKSRGLAPAGLVFGRTNPVMVQGAVLAGIPILDGLAPEAFTQIASGDVVRVDPLNLRVEVIKRGNS
jgi:predicted aconitase with swiveling domain